MASGRVLAILEYSMRFLSLILCLASNALALPGVGKPAPPLTVDHIIGAPAGIDLSWETGLKGRSVVLEFWATWCTPCREQIPHLNALVRKYRAHPLTFLALTDEDDVALIHRFMQQTPIEGFVGIDRRSQTFERYGVIGRPTTVLIDASGIVRAVLTSKRLDEEMLDLLLAEKSVPTDMTTRASTSAPSASKSDSIIELRIKPAAPVSVSGFSPGLMEAKGNSFRGWGLDMKRLASLAYGFPEDRIVVSEPLAKNRYDVSLITPTGSLRQSSGLLKQALENAFNIRVTSDMRPSEVYVLAIDRGGTKNLRRSDISSSRIWLDGSKLTAVNSTFGDLAGSLARIVGKPVLDETQTETRYDFKLDIGDGHSDRVSDVLQSHLGLTLRLATRSREYLIIQ